MFWKAGVFRADALVEDGDSRDVVGLVRESNGPSPGFRGFSTTRPSTRTFVAVEYAPPSLHRYPQKSSHAAQTSEVSKTSEVLIAARPRYGTPRAPRPFHPAMNRWAILKCPSGARGDVQLNHPHTSESLH